MTVLCREFLRPLHPLPPPRLCTKAVAGDGAPCEAIALSHEKKIVPLEEGKKKEPSWRTAILSIKGSINIITYDNCNRIGK